MEKLTPDNTPKKAPKENALGLTRKDYSGAPSTLCTGCGHDSVTNHIISAFYQAGISPQKVAKLSGIGCSSKTPTYFMSQTHGFNAIHGRMAPLATGVKAVNHDLTLIGVSGDGDTASIGLGGFAHWMRRQVPMIYIVENNGVYGLTKGQFSATADTGSISKGGESAELETIDLCSLALELGCSFVGRAFSGDAKQLVPMIAAAAQHQGAALIDVVSPCVTYANHEGSTKSYDYVKEHKVNLQELGYIPPKSTTEVDYAEGESQIIDLADGSKLTLRKLQSASHNISDRVAAKKLLEASHQKSELLTGLFYWDQNVQDFCTQENLSNKPLVHLSEKDLRPRSGYLEELLADFR